MAATVGQIIEVPSQTEVARRPLEDDKTALIVIDIQEELRSSILDWDQTVRNAQLLVRLALMMNMPILATTQDANGLGQTVPQITSLLDDTESFDRLEFGCFNDEGFRAAAKRLPGNRDTLLVCGMESHIAVTQTALGALNQGYIVHVPSDAVSSRTEWNWRIGLERMKQAGAVISSTEMAIYELMRTSGTAAFQEMLKHLK